MPGKISISVDGDFARFGNKSYAIGKINMVEVKAAYPYSRHPVMGWGLLAMLAFVVFVGSEGAPNAGNLPVVCLVLCLLFVALGYRAWQRGKIIEYQLLLVTSSQSVQAIKSRDEAFIHGIRDRIERAIAGQLA